GKKLIFATGIKDQMPAIKGFEDCWGVSIIHCPYCHGYEFRNQNTGMFANGEKAFHLASLVRNLTSNLTILTNGKADFSVEQLEKLNKNDIKIISTEVAEIAHENGHVKHVVFEDGKPLNFDAIYAAIPFVQHTEMPVALGCELTEHGYIKVDHMQKTTVEHVFACGDNSGMMRSIANAVHSGNLTGAMVNALLSAEMF
ncbi:MAG: NAD(P)/FAD-dependent oxidoreductase, partial [Sphingobacterium sp.]